MGGWCHPDGLAPSLSLSAHQHHTRRRAASDIVLQLGARLLNLALGVVVTAVLVRALGDAGYGKWSTILVSLELIGYFMQFGLESVVVREAAADPEHEGEWIGALMLVRLGMAVPAVIAALAVLLAIQDGHEMLIAGIILVLGMPFGGTGGLQIAFQLRVNNRVPMLVLTLKSVLWGAAVIAISIAGGGMVALALALVLTNAVGALVLALAALRLTNVRLRPSRRYLRQLVRVGAPVGIAGLLVIAYARIDQLLVFQIAGATEAGYYGSVYHVLEQAHFLPTTVLTTLAPIIAASWAVDRERMARAVWQGAELLAIASLGGLAVAIVAADPLVTLVFGEDFAPAAPALPVLAGAFVLVCFGYLTSNVLLVIGRQKRLVVVSVLALIANLGANVILIPRYGFMGAAWTTLLTELVVVGASVVFIMQGLGTRRVEAGRLPRIVLAAALLTIGVELVTQLGGPLIAVLATAAVLYPALLLGLRALRIDDLRALARKQLPGD